MSWLIFIRRFLCLVLKQSNSELKVEKFKTGLQGKLSQFGTVTAPSQSGLETVQSLQSLYRLISGTPPLPLTRAAEIARAVVKRAKLAQAGWSIYGVATTGKMLVSLTSDDWLLTVRNTSGEPEGKACQVHTVHAV